MNRWIATFVLLFSFLGTLEHGFPCASADESRDTIEVVQSGPTISATGHCNGPSDHKGNSPSGEHCHSHGHCHCGFLVSGTAILTPNADSSNKANTSTFHLSSHIENLFRPPISA